MGEGAVNHFIRRALRGEDLIFGPLTVPPRDLEPWPARRPVWHVEPTDIDRRLERLLIDRALRLRLAEAGRRYVERHHDAEDVAARALARLAGRRRRR